MAKLDDNSDPNMRNPSKDKPPQKTKKDYEIGYGKPPKKHQFKKGQSGNAKGRPKGSKNMSTLFGELLDSTVPANVNGAKFNLPFKEAIVKQMGARALNGSMTDMVKFVASIDRYMPEQLKSAENPHTLLVRFIESDGNGRPANPEDLEPITDFSKVRISDQPPGRHADWKLTNHESSTAESEEAWNASGIDDESDAT